MFCCAIDLVKSHQVCLDTYQNQQLSNERRFVIIKAVACFPLNVYQ